MDRVITSKSSSFINNQLKTLFLDKKDRLIRTAYSILRNEEDAYDAVQETYYEALKHNNDIREPQYLTTWVYRILINKCNRIAKKGKVTVELKNNYINSNEKSIEEIENKIYVEEILLRLSEEHRQIVVLKYIEDFTIDEISEIVGIPSGTVKSRLHYAIDNIRKFYNGKEK